jgi:hypothetical protein
MSFRVNGSERWGPPGVSWMSPGLGGRHRRCVAVGIAEIGCRGMKLLPRSLPGAGPWSWFPSRRRVGGDVRGGGGRSG